MNASEGLAVARRHILLIGLVVLLSAAIAFGASFMWSPQYVAVTHVLVRVREARILTATGEDVVKQQAVVDATLAKAVGQTHSSLLRSRELAELVVAELALDKRAQDPSFVAELRRSIKRAYKFVVDVVRYGYYAEPSAYEAAVISVQQNLEGKPIKDSYVVEVSARADSPQLAAAIADSATKGLIELGRARARQEAQRYRDFLKAQVERTGEEVLAADQEVRRYKEDIGITDVAERIRHDAQSYESLRLQKRDTEVELATAQARSDALLRDLERVARTESTTSTIASGRSTTTMTNTQTNRLFQELQAESATVKAELAGLEARLATLNALLEPREMEGSLLPEQEAALRNLELKRAAANDAYRAVREDYEAALVKSEQDPLEITPVDHAAVPLYPASPNRILFLFAGLIGGMVAGLALAYAADRRRAMATVPVPVLFPQPGYRLQSGREVEATAKLEPQPK